MGNNRLCIGVLHIVASIKSTHPHIYDPLYYAHAHAREWVVTYVVTLETFINIRYHP